MRLFILLILLLPLGAVVAQQPKVPSSVMPVPMASDTMTNDTMRRGMRLSMERALLRGISLRPRQRTAIDRVEQYLDQRIREWDDSLTILDAQRDHADFQGDTVRSKWARQQIRYQTEAMQVEVHHQILWLAQTILTARQRRQFMTNLAAIQAAFPFVAMVPSGV